ncbi:MAG: hypothetical protein WC817_05075 [Patescibacteria group bacterium]|jgi:membrane-bound inhibitor of C-type lysozyme
MTKKLTLTTIALLCFATGLYLWFVVLRPVTPESVSDYSNVPVISATYLCNEEKNIAAFFYADTSTSTKSLDKTQASGGTVRVRLNDGRTLTLSRVATADVARYVNSDESFIFIKNGNGAVVTENNKQTYTGCVLTLDDPGNLPRVYANGADGISIRYPEDYSLNADYSYQELGSGKEIKGVSFPISSSIAAGTNLSDDSYLSVEVLPTGTSCTAALFLDERGQGINVRSVTENSVTYSEATSSGAAAGNRYDETVYALSSTNPCIAVRYFIHSTVLENYPPGVVKQFDREALLQQFDAMRRTLVVAQSSS